MRTLDWTVFPYLVENDFRELAFRRKAAGELQKNVQADIVELDLEMRAMMKTVGVTHIYVDGATFTVRERRREHIDADKLRIAFGTTDPHLVEAALREATVEDKPILSIVIRER